MFGIRLHPELRYLLPCALLLPLLFTVDGRAELADGCVALGEAMVEHSCFHSTFGPFVSVPGTPGKSVTSETPNVDAVHTEYRVGLPVVGQVHLITYGPERSGNWAIFTATDIELELIDERGDGVPLVFEQRGDTGCDALPIARVFSLKAKQRYTLRLGPAPVTSELLVIEYADDFLVRVGRDQDGDGFGSTVDAFVTNCSPPADFAPNTSDCDDTDPAVHPDAVERCDDVDDNCNGSPDDVGLQCRTGAGACLAVGQFTCDGEAATCNAAPIEPEPESCNGMDDDCDGVIDNNGDALCKEEDKPRCVRRELVAFCGCLLDIDCGELDSGLFCNVEAQRCEEGCSTALGGNGCPEGEVCETEGGISRGVCVPQEPTQRPDEQVQQRGLRATSEDEGCQCTLGSSSTSRWQPLALLGMFVAAWRRRRVGRALHTPESKDSNRDCVSPFLT